MKLHELKESFKGLTADEMNRRAEKGLVTGKDMEKWATEQNKNLASIQWKVVYRSVSLSKGPKGTTMEVPVLVDEPIEESTDSRTDIIKSIVNEPELVKLRKELTMYKAKDEAFARFRLKMTNLIAGIVTDYIQKGKISSKMQKEFDSYTSSADWYADTLKAWFELFDKKFKESMK